MRPKGHWSFLHEWVIYDYLLARAEGGTLRIRKVIENGKLVGKPRWVKVDSLPNISSTKFPDIDAIRLKGEKEYRPAEVKFTTSLFNYHNKKYKVRFEQFVTQGGFILVAAHDYLPTDGLLKLYPLVDVFELELDDFVNFCRENFSRLLNRQIKAHTSTRVWIMYQGPNFNKGLGEIKPARESLLWCPTENLSGFDLAPGDRLLFIKTSGSHTRPIQKKFLEENTIDSRWLLNEIIIAEVVSKIFSRTEYADYKKQPHDKQLWINDPINSNTWRWSRVFEFKIIKPLTINKDMKSLYQNPQAKNFVTKALEAFCYSKSREISLKDYRNLLEALT
jgi:hypothetical protein